MNRVLQLGPALDLKTWSELRRVMELRHHKWDVHVGDEAALSSTPLLMSRAAWEPVPTLAVFAAVTVTCLASWLLMRYAAKVGDKIPKTLLRAFERIMGLLLAAVAVEFIAGGIRDMTGTSVGS